MADLSIRDLSERSRLLSELDLETLDHSKHTFSKERKIEVWVLLLDNVEDLLSPEVNVSVLEVEALLTLIKSFGGIFSLPVLNLELTGEAGHFDL